MKKNIIYILLCLTLLSCEKTIDFNEKSAKPLMVLYSYINPNKYITAEITKSQSVINEFKLERITNAEVSVFEDDVLFEKLSYDEDSKLYKGTKQPVVGKTYLLKSSTAGFDNISSQTIIPVKPTISGFSYTITDKETSDEKISATIKFKDDPSKKNYYRIVVEEETYIENPEDNSYTATSWTNEGWFYGFELDGNIQRKWFEVKSKDPAITGKGQSGADDYFDDIPDNIFAVFNDDLFDGEEYSLEFSFNTYYYEWGHKKVTVYLMSVTEDYYLYLKSYSSQIYFEDNPFSEPVQIYTNIENGAGLMGAYNYDGVLVYDRMNMQ